MVRLQLLGEAPVLSLLAIGVPLARAPTDSSRDVESLSKEKLGFSSPVVAETVNLDDLSEEDERRLVRKVDLKVVPFVAILYFLSFLDRYVVPLLVKWMTR